MTDDNVAGEGPYRIKQRNHWWHVDGLGEEQRLNQWAYKIGAEWWASKLNFAYAEGKKAERERCAKIAESHVTKLNGFQIADAIRGGQDGE